MAAVLNALQNVEAAYPPGLDIGALELAIPGQESGWFPPAEAPTTRRPLERARTSGRVGRSPFHAEGTTTGFAVRGKPRSSVPMSELERILEEGQRIPVMPAAVLRLFALARDPRAGIAQIEASIRPDVTLAANVLRLANSATYGQCRRIDDIRMAVTLLGARRVCDLAASAHVLQIAGKYVHGYGIEAKAFWTHCSAVALLSENIAKRHAPSALGHAFLCGLLHDVGKIAISQAWLGNPFELDLSRGASRLDWLFAERSLLGTDHAEVGSSISAVWQLPPLVGQVIRWHHAPKESPEPSRPAASVVHVGNGLSHAMGFGSHGAAWPGMFDEEVGRNLGLDGAALERLALETEEAIVAASDLHGER